jgi:predicted ATP-dependent endonuclease of OLD family
MKLKKVHVTNFRSVEDSEPFSVDQVTCLVGKNEAGKTAILQAIAGLNPHESTPIHFDKERDYPRRYLTEYANRHPEKDAEIVSTLWELSPNELDAIKAEFGECISSDSDVKIVRRYNATSAEWTVPINFKTAVQHLIAKANFSASEKSQVQSVESIVTLREALESIKEKSEKHNSLLQKINSYPSKSITGKVREILTDKFPKFMYFSNYDRMSGEVSVEQLKDQVDKNLLFTDASLTGDRLFFEFLSYAGVPLGEILSAETFESFNAKLQGASNAITDQIIEYWSQNPDISVNVAINFALPKDPPPFDQGKIARARIRNELHRVDVPFSERSAGFIWFFSFLIKFAQVKNAAQPTILLLDEPGLTLHGKAQGDLLRYFVEKLAPNHQIIYSTHSPFMVPPDKITSARIVEDLVSVASPSGRRTPIGTKVREDVFSTDPDAVFPLQGALGYEITQTLFVGKHTLLVEGPSDILYLKAVSGALGEAGRETLDPRWTICPTGGVGNIRAFVSLFKGNSLNVVALADMAKGDRKTIERLKESQILKSGGVLTLDQFTAKNEADIEDIFSPSLFILMVNEAYGLKNEHALTIEKLAAADTSTSRIVKQAEAFFRSLPQRYPLFDHYVPAQWFFENTKIMNGKGLDVRETLDRAEALIKAINPLIVD